MVVGRFRQEGCWKQMGKPASGELRWLVAGKDLGVVVLGKAG